MIRAYCVSDSLFDSSGLTPQLGYQLQSSIRRRCCPKHAGVLGLDSHRVNDRVVKVSISLLILKAAAIDSFSNRVSPEIRRVIG